MTWLKAISDNEVMTCSYDGTVRIWDERNIKSGAVEEISFPGKSLWDVNYHLCPESGKLWMGIASIYDGYFFLRPNSGTTPTSSSLAGHFAALKAADNNACSFFD